MKVKENSFLFSIGKAQKMGFEYFQWIYFSSTWCTSCVVDKIVCTTVFTGCMILRSVVYAWNLWIWIQLKSSDTIWDFWVKCRHFASTSTVSDLDYLYLNFFLGALTITFCSSGPRSCWANYHPFNRYQKVKKWRFPQSISSTLSRHPNKLCSSYGKIFQ